MEHNSHCPHCKKRTLVGKFCGHCGGAMHEKNILYEEELFEPTQPEVLGMDNGSPPLDEGISKNLKELKERARKEINNPLPHIEMGQIHLEMENYDEAIKEFKVARTLAPEYLETYYYLGKAYFIQARWIDSREELENLRGRATASSLAKDHRYDLIMADSLNYLGLCYEKTGFLEKAALALEESLTYWDRFRLQGTLISGIPFQPEEVLLSLAGICLNRGEFDRARIELERFENYWGSTPECHFLRGALFRKQRFFDGALGEYKKLQDHPRFHLKARINSAETLVEMEVFDRAILAYEKILEEFPDSVEALLGLGKLYKEIRIYEKADDCFKKLRALAPENITLRYEFGREAQKNELYLNAAEDFEAVIAMDPYFRQAYEALLEVYHKLSKFEDYKNCLEKLLKHFPDNRQGLLAQGLVFHKGGNLQEARKVFQKLIYLNQEDVEAIYHLGRTLIHLGDYSSSEENFENLKKLAPEDPRGYSFNELVREDKNFKEGEKWVAQARQNLNEGNLQGSLQKIEKALLLCPTNVTWRKLQSDLFFKIGQFSRAKNILEDLLNKEADDPEVLERLALLHYVEENPREALDLYEKLCQMDKTNFNFFLEYLWLNYEIYSGTDFFLEAFQKREAEINRDTGVSPEISWTRRGFLHLVLGIFVNPLEKSLQEAEKCFHKALDFSQEFNPALYGLIKVSAFSGQFHESYGFYQRVCKGLPSERVHSEFLFYCIGTEHYSEAQKILDRLIREFPENHYFRYLKIFFLAKEFTGPENGVHCQKTIQGIQQSISPESPASYFDYALSLLFLGGSNEREQNRQKIQMALSKALKIDPGFLWAHYAGSLSFLEFSNDQTFRVNFPTQMAILEKVCREVPQDVYARYFLAHLLIHHPDEKYLKKAQGELVKALAGKKFFVPAYKDLLEVAKKRALKSRHRYLKFRYAFLTGDLNSLRME